MGQQRAAQEMGARTTPPTPSARGDGGMGGRSRGNAQTTPGAMGTTSTPSARGGRGGGGGGKGREHAQISSARGLALASSARGGGGGGRRGNAQTLGARATPAQSSARRLRERAIQQREEEALDANRSIKLYRHLYYNCILKDGDDAQAFAQKVSANQTRMDRNMSQLHVHGYNLSKVIDSKPILMQAARYGKTNICTKLVQMGCDINMANSDNGNTAMHCAAFFGHPDTLDALISLPAARVEGNLNFGAYDISMLAMMGYKKFIYDARAAKSKEHDPFHVCYDSKKARPPYEKVFEILWKKFPHVNWQISADRYAQILDDMPKSRAKRCHSRLMSLVQHGDHPQDVEAVLAGTYSAQETQSLADCSTNRLYIDGFDVSTMDPEIPLVVHAAKFGRTRIVEALVKMGCCINTQCSVLGNNALHAAAFYGHVETVKSLVSLGADLKALNKRGLNAGQMASKGMSQYNDSRHTSISRLNRDNPFHVCFDFNGSGTKPNHHGVLSCIGPLLAAVGMTASMPLPAASATSSCDRTSRAVLASSAAAVRRPGDSARTTAAPRGQQSHACTMPQSNVPEAPRGLLHVRRMQATRPSEKECYRAYDDIERYENLASYHLRRSSARTSARDDDGDYGDDDAVYYKPRDVKKLFKKQHRHEL
jgi:ankyrin repeat protein